jgi:hypothetical protein
MKFPIPPTGGQGGRYGGSTGRIRMFDNRRKAAKPGRVARRFRGFRLRRSKRSRMAEDHPMMTVVAILLVAVPALIMLYLLLFN